MAGRMLEQEIQEIKRDQESGDLEIHIYFKKGQQLGSRFWFKPDRGPKIRDLKL